MVVCKVPLTRLQTATNMTKSSLCFRWVVAFAVLVFTGCASGTRKDFTGDATRFINLGDWDKAYRSLEDGLGSNESATRLAAYDLIVLHPELKLAASRSFEPLSLEKTFTAFDPVSANAVETVRLAWYEKFASDDDVARARTNIEAALVNANKPRAALLAARQNIGKGLIVDDAIFDQLDNADRETFRGLYPTMQVIPSKSVGKVISHQVLDKSKPGSTSGSQLGAAVGQSAYIDHAFSQRSYSAVGQLSAGLLGAMIGSSFDKAAESKFLVNYGIELTDGTVKAVLLTSSDGIAAPIGQCVFIADAVEAPSYLCADSIVKFIERVKQMKSAEGSPAKSKSEDHVSCTIDSVGAIKLSREDCRRLKGEVVER